MDRQQIQRDLLGSSETPAADFEAIYRAHVERIYRYCHARLRDRTAAEDATSETFLKALRSLPRSHPDNVTAWLFVIARNVTTDQLRAPATARVERAAEEVAANDAGPEQAALNAEEEERFRAALDALRSDQRSAIELQLAGWTLAESAEAMGKSLAAVKMLRARAVARLRTELSSTEEEGPQHATQ